MALHLEPLRHSPGHPQSMGLSVSYPCLIRLIVLLAGTEHLQVTRTLTSLASSHAARLQVNLMCCEPSLSAHIALVLCRAIRYALRVMEVPQLAVALESLGAPSEALASAGSTKPRMALLCAARPVTFTWMPDGRSLIAVRLSPGSSYDAPLHQSCCHLRLTMIAAKRSTCTTHI